jgi:ABC-type Fe3+-citrate transport system substrate-binding protein
MKLILLISIFLMTLLHAVVVNEVTIKKLSKEPTWLKLLHFKDGKSTIIDNNFFLDDNGNISAKKELERTIEARVSKSHPI